MVQQSLLSLPAWSHVVPLWDAFSTHRTSQIRSFINTSYILCRNKRKIFIKTRINNGKTYRVCREICTLAYLSVLRILNSRKKIESLQKLNFSINMSSISTLYKIMREMLIIIKEWFNMEMLRVICTVTYYAQSWLSKMASAIWKFRRGVARMLINISSRIAQIARSRPIPFDVPCKRYEREPFFDSHGDMASICELHARTHVRYIHERAVRTYRAIAKKKRW